MTTAGAPARMSRHAENFYAEALAALNRSKVPFMVAGTFAVNAYTGIDRPTKDLDIFCKASDFPKIVAYFGSINYKVEIPDERWLAKVWKGRYFFDLIFNSSIALTPVTDSWFAESRTATIYKSKVNVLPPTELIWSKVFVQDRYKYDGSDIAHVILTESQNVDWRRLLTYMEQFWEVLLIHVLNFRFIYPSEREKIPRWLFDELVDRLKRQADLPTTQAKVCRGRLFSMHDYDKDIYEWGFVDIIGRASDTR